MHVRCNNCEWEGEDDAEGFTPLWACSDLTERLDPGEDVPAGDCPECRCFCYVDNDHVLEPSNAEYILDAIRTDVAYAIEQLRRVQSELRHTGLLDGTQRALDALERIQSNLTPTTVLPSEWTTEQIIDREA